MMSPQQMYRGYELRAGLGELVVVECTRCRGRGGARGWQYPPDAEVGTWTLVVLGDVLAAADEHEREEHGGYGLHPVLRAIAEGPLPEGSRLLVCTCDVPGDAEPCPAWSAHSDTSYDALRAACSDVANGLRRIMDEGGER